MENIRRAFLLISRSNGGINRDRNEARVLREAQKFIDLCPYRDDLPAVYRQLPKGVRCRCLKLWREADGGHWCCNPKWLEEAERERHEQEIRALAATNGQDFT